MTPSRSDRFWFWQCHPIRFPGGFIRQFRQWYALGRDVYGAERAGVGNSRKEARQSLEKCLEAVRRYEERSLPSGRTNQQEETG